MASQAYYIAVEEKVLALNKAIGELQEVLDLEIKQNQTDKLSPENYDVQGTLSVNINWLAKRLTAAALLMKTNADNSMYQPVNYSANRGEHYV